MRGAFVAAEDVAAFGAVAAGFCVEQDLHLPCEQGDLCVLARDH